MIATERASEITKSPARSRRGERVAARKRGSAATRSSPRDRVRRDRGEAPNALREKWRAYGGRTVEPTYNDYGEVETYTATVGGLVQVAWSYVRDDLGRIVEKTETTPAGTRVLVYEYDLAARLSAVYEDGLLAESYGYDDNGNRLSSLNADGVFDAAFDEQDRILEYGDDAFTWTDNGELLARTDTATGDTMTCAYDAVGNLRGVGLPNGDLLEYLVDGRGRRVGKKLNGALERGWLWRGQLQPVAELDGAGNVVARFVYAGGVNVPALMVTPTATYRLVTDHLGSVRRVLDVATGAVVQELEYDAWGRVLLDTSPGLQPFGFAGGLYDPDTGLVRFGARDYDAETGRWTSKDPIRFSGGSNFYEYSRSSPIMGRDPTGLDSVLDWVDELVLFGAPIVLPALPSVGMACARAAPYVAAVGGVGATIWQTTELVNEWDTDTFTDAICGDFGACVDDSSAEDEEEQYCKRAKQRCISYCTEETLPTGSYDGMPFHKCMRDCMELAGC